MGVVHSGYNDLLLKSVPQGCAVRGEEFFTDYLHSIMLSAPYELQIELVIGIIGSILFIGLLLYRL